MSLRNWFTLSNSQVLRVFLIVSDFCTSFLNLVDHRSAYLWPTSFERQGDVVWKSCLFPRAQSSFRVRSWVPMKRLQQSCAKLKLCTGLATRAAYLKPCPRHPASVESNSLRQEWVNKRLKRTLEFDSTVAVRPSRGRFVPRCRARRRLCGREPPGPDPHTTFQLWWSSFEPDIFEMQIGTCNTQTISQLQQPVSDLLMFTSGYNIKPSQKPHFCQLHFAPMKLI